MNNLQVQCNYTQTGSLHDRNQTQLFRLDKCKSMVWRTGRINSALSLIVDWRQSTTTHHYLGSDLKKSRYEKFEG